MYLIVVLFLVILIVVGLGFTWYKFFEGNKSTKETSTKVSEQVKETNKNTDKVENSNQNQGTAQNVNTQINLNYDEIYKGELQKVYDKVMASEDEYYGYPDGGTTETKVLPQYCYYDIDKNGVKELIVSIGYIEAEKVTYCYTYSNNQVIDLGIIGGGHSILYTMNNEKYLLKVVAHMGEEKVTHIKIENNKIVEEEVSTRKVPVEEDYTEGDKELEFKEYNPNGNTAKTSDNSKEEIVKQAYLRYLQKISKENDIDNGKLLDYRVDQVAIIGENEKNSMISRDDTVDYKTTDIFAYVTYSVKPEKINETNWDAGNGEKDGEWIKNKKAVVVVRDEEVISSGTGW